MGKSISVPANAQDLLATLRHWNLVQDNSGPHRVYRDKQGNEYASVTHILSETSDKTGLIHWEKRLGTEMASQHRRVAATRGTMCHSQAEYFLKTSRALAYSAASKRGVVKFNDQGLATIPPALVQWAMERVHPKLPPVGFSGAGYARGLTGWIKDNVVGIHASEFMISHPQKFAGQCDGLIDIKGVGLCLADWKTSANKKDLYDPKNIDHNYRLQCGAYSLGLRYITNLDVAGAAVIIARRCGEPSVFILDKDALKEAEERFLKRVDQYYSQLELNKKPFIA